MNNIDILPFKLKIATVHRNELPKLMYHIVDWIFNRREVAFFCLTETDGEITLILPSYCLRELDLEGSSITIEVSAWACLHVYSGEAGHHGETNLIHAVSQPLAEAGISIFQLSTYECDYTLVPVQMIDKAKDCLSGSFLINDQLCDETVSARSPVNLTAQTPSISLDSLQFATGKESLNVCFARLDASESIAMSLMRLIFFSERPRFFSVTKANSGLSLIMESSDFALYPRIKSLNSRSGWRWIRASTAA